ncbi:hypothetical protein QFW85_26870 [Vibrio chagasii]|uniref:hypothetical protein n=1 Tax=Vibrio chagasii TaxID=170679 RepID=UPI003DA93D03
MSRYQYKKKNFVARSKIRWGTKFGYEKVIYVNSRTPVELFCLKHGFYFEQTPKAHFTAKHECCPLCYKLISGYYQNLWRNVNVRNEKKVVDESLYVLLLNSVFKDN